MYLAIIKQYVCPAFPKGIQMLDFKTKRDLFDYLGTLRLIDTPYIALKLEKSKAKIIDWFRQEEVAKAYLEGSENES